jgi:hypothetical protein
MPVMFHELVDTMTASDADILGDLFQGAITYGEAGQYFSPECIARLLAAMSVDPDARPSADRPLLISDPCCGTGRMLLEASKINPHAELVAQDIDSRCAKITAINMGLRGSYGWVICGNSLSAETTFAYRIGSFFHETPRGLRRGVIRDVPPTSTSVAAVAHGMRRGAKDLLDQAPEDGVLADSPSPTIVAVPRWLARLEPKLTALDRGQGDPTEPSTDDLSETPEAPPRVQQRLF